MASQSGRGHESAETSSQQKTVESSDRPKVSGSCACGSTSWTSTYLPTRASFCYCSTCRKISGGAFIAFMDLPTSSVAFIPPTSSPSSNLKTMAISKNAERGFCSMCGSTLTMQYSVMPETLYLTMASVDGDAIDSLEGLSKKHIYVGEKVDWYKLPDDGFPRFDTMPNQAKYLVLED